MNFSDSLKATNDLLFKNYADGVSAKVTKADKVKYVASANFSSPAGTSFEVSHKGPEFSVEKLVFSGNKSVAAEFSYKNAVVPGGLFHFKAADTYKGHNNVISSSLGFDFTNPQSITKLELDVINNKFSANTMYKYLDYFFGGEVKTSFAKKPFSIDDYNVAVGVSLPAYRIFARTFDKMKSVQVGFNLKDSRGAEMGTLVKSDVCKFNPSNVKVTTGISYKLYPEGTFFGKVNEQGKVGLALLHQINKSTDVTISTTLDAGNLAASDNKVGLKFNIGL